jgi:integrase
LNKQKDAQEKTQRNLADRWRDLDLVFTMPLGHPINSEVLGSKYFKPLLAKAGLPSTIRLDDLRHTMATLLLVAGENPKVVSERLGHASVTLRLDAYSHVLPLMRREATKKLEGLLRKFENY